MPGKQCAWQQQRSNSTSHCPSAGAFTAAFQAQQPDNPLEFLSPCPTACQDSWHTIYENARRVLSQTDSGSELTMLSVEAESPQAQAVLMESVSVAAKHTAFRASSRCRAAKMCLVNISPPTATAAQGPLYRHSVSEGQRLQNPSRY